MCLNAVRSPAMVRWIVGASLAMVVLAVAPSAHAAASFNKSRTAKVGPASSAHLRFGSHLEVFVPKGTLLRRGKVTAVWLDRHGMLVKVSAPWRRRIRVVSRNHGTSVSEL